MQAAGAKKIKCSGRARQDKGNRSAFQFCRKEFCPLILIGPMASIDNLPNKAIFREILENMKNHNFQQKQKLSEQPPNDCHCQYDVISLISFNQQIIICFLRMFHRESVDLTSLLMRAIRDLISVMSVDFTLLDCVISSA